MRCGILRAAFLCGLVRLALPCFPAVHGGYIRIEGTCSPAETFFVHYWQTLGLTDQPLLPKPTIESLDEPLDTLQRSAPGVRLQLVRAISAAMELDGEITDNEFELFRTQAVCLDRPIPPPQPGKLHL